MKEPVFQDDKRIAGRGFSKITLIRYLAAGDATEEIQAIFDPLVTEHSKKKRKLEDNG